MAKASTRAPVLGPAFIRLLARFGDAELPRTPPLLTERLAQWFDWSRALALSQALDGRLPAVERSEGADDDAHAECVQARQALQQAIDAGAEVAPEAEGYLPYQRHCLATQRAMQASTGRLRGRLRDRLAALSSEQARLAELDAVMEAALSPREQALLAIVPKLLGLHYQRLCEAGAVSPAGADAPADHPAASSWLARFRQDLRTALLAELELRFHPIDGLLAALRTR